MCSQERHPCRLLRARNPARSQAEDSVNQPSPAFGELVELQFGKLTAGRVRTYLLKNACALRIYYSYMHDIKEWACTDALPISLTLLIRRPPQIGDTVPHLGETLSQPGETFPHRGETIPHMGERILLPGESVPQLGETISLPGERILLSGEIISHQGERSPCKRGYLFPAGDRFVPVISTSESEEKSWSNRNNP